MIPSNIKPWSQLDDELEEHKGTESAPAVDSRNDAGSSETRSNPDRQGFGRVFLKITALWACPPLAAATIWAVCGILGVTGEEPGLSPAEAAGIVVLLLLAGGVLAAGHLARKAALRNIHTAFGDEASHGSGDSADLSLGPDLLPIWKAAEAHTRNIQARLAELLEDHKQLGLELSLAEAHRRQAETVVNCIGNPVLVMDAFDQLILANPAAEELFGFTRESAVRRAISEIIPDETLVKVIRQARAADIRAAARGAKHVVGTQSYAVRLTPMGGVPGGADETGYSGDHGVVAVFRNITKEHEAAKNKSEFVAQAAHELRTPLSSISAYVEMLVDGEAADEKTRKEYYDIIHSSAERLGRMIDNILNISRIEAGTVRISKEPVSISMIVKEAVDVALPQAEEKGITLSQELTPVVFQVVADRDMIYQAVLNLLSNAIKYTPDGGKVHVRMMPQEESRTIRIEVRDTGVGIPKGDLPHMFQKFFRVESNKKMAKGTGLGLNLVKNIVETIHDGKMTLTSQEGKGSTFGMVLPLAS